MPAHNYKDLAGQRFGRLTVLERAGSHPKKGNALFRCVCDCGEERIVEGCKLTSGNTTSCGCSRIHDLTGARFGKLLVIEMAAKREYSNRGRFWICQCDCGSVVEVQNNSLVGGGTRSCGCGQKNELERPVRARYSRVKSSAKERGYAFELPLEQFDALTSQLCHYCGQMRGSYNGVDRIDSSLGYVEGNCVPCCWICNRFKGADLSPAELAEVARDIYLHSIKETL